MKMVKAKIELTPEQREAVLPLYEALQGIAPTGLGMTIGQLDKQGILSNFDCAVFFILDHEAGAKVQKLVRKEVKRMNSGESRAAMVADAAKKAEAKSGS